VRTTSRLLRWTVPIGLAIGLSGCNATADYLNRRDTVTLAAGNAKNWNLAVQTIDPWPPHAEDTSIEHSGKRIAAVVRDYQGDPQQSVGATTEGASNRQPADQPAL
jgi:hypothetical protein